MQAGFELTVRGGAPRLQIVEPREAADVPLTRWAQDAEADLTVVLIGFLTYRSDLPVPTTLSDPDAVLALYRDKGAEALMRLEGDFALALVDGRARQTFALRDPMGAWPLYFRATGEGVSISTNLLSLAAAAGDPTLSTEFLSHYLMPSFAATELDTDKTVFAGIGRVTPGSLMRFAPGEPARQVAQYEWRWPDNILSEDDAPFQSDAEDQYREMLDQAIAERARGAVTAHLSGGMDSSAIVRLLADRFHTEQKRRRLSTLSLVYDIESLKPERDYIDRVLKRGGPIDPHYINGDALLAFQWFDAPMPVHDEPHAGLFYISAERRLADEAGALGTDVVMTGNGAEVSVQGTRHFIADLARRGQFGKALNEVRLLADAKNTSLWRVLQATTLRPLVPVTLRDGVIARLKKGEGGWPNLGSLGIAPWLDRDWAREHKLWDRAAERTVAYNRFPVARNMPLAGLRATAGEWGAWHLASQHGIQTARPFLDPRLIEFALSLPVDYREHPHWPKPLLSGGMKNVLPKSIRTRTVKRNFNDIVWNGLQDNLEPLRDLIDRADNQGVVPFDKQILAKGLSEHAHGSVAPAGALRLSGMLALLYWLEKRGEWTRPMAGASVDLSAGGEVSP
ncbi:MAG: asparagine synthase-related protein [Pseudomonadota bacterium]